MSLAGPDVESLQEAIERLGRECAQLAGRVQRALEERLAAELKALEAEKQLKIARNHVAVLKEGLASARGELIEKQSLLRSLR